MSAASASTPKVYLWQYNGVAPWTDIVNWCMDNLYHGGYYEPNWGTNHRETLWFTDEREYAWFLLRWA